MAFSYDLDNSIGQLRLEIRDKNESDYIWEDAEITYFLNKAGAGGIDLAVYNMLVSMEAELVRDPSGSTIGGYTESWTVSSLRAAIDAKKKVLEDKGIGLDGEDVAQFGSIDIARDRNSYNEVEHKKALKGETY